MQFNDKSIRAKVLPTSILVFILAFALGWVAINSYRSLLMQRQQIALEKNLVSKASELTQVIDHRFVLLSGVRAFVLTNLEQFDRSGYSSDPAAVNLFLKEIYAPIVSAP